MKTHKIRTLLHLPVVPVVVVGPKTARRIELIFDSGAATTQIHIGTLRAIGFDYSKRQPDVSMQGVTGSPEQGFSTQLQRIHVLGNRYDQSTIGAFDFSRWIKDGIDGLLGWDLIEKMHFEVDGPRKLRCTMPLPWNWPSAATLPADFSKTPLGCQLSQSSTLLVILRNMPKGNRRMGNIL